MNCLKKKMLTLVSKNPPMVIFTLLSIWQDLQMYRKSRLKPKDLTKRQLLWLKRVWTGGGLLISYMAVGESKRPQDASLKQSETTNHSQSVSKKEP